MVDLPTPPLPDPTAMTLRMRGCGANAPCTACAAILRSPVMRQPPAQQRAPPRNHFPPSCSSPTQHVVCHREQREHRFARHQKKGVSVPARSEATGRFARATQMRAQSLRDIQRQISQIWTQD
ncbi:hypothetical protein XFF6166_620003 [Xanthomonas citri pv. fuscans]|nr:hypothetical protein XFF6166_620003 [Xanthomonas citri pv. fuscans]SON99238.1 hypothetical protein XFF6960_150003 [Xanthomonas citri pv. fuscans]SOO06577.1 hypothetical protein XFF7767_780003 [Xanthomonas citri pv. fuscans]SOO10408.1 hypothetical protein XFF6970_560013 [Xanthomonas citri pv. fuscans]SOO16052.1 hypothetical protein XFF7766_730003 [Xanthomonas citri pv. fuscans]